jgi:hypothetical protein
MDEMKDCRTHRRTAVSISILILIHCTRQAMGMRSLQVYSCLLHESVPVCRLGWLRYVALPDKDVEMYVKEGLPTIAASIFYITGPRLSNSSIWSAEQAISSMGGMHRQTSQMTDIPPLANSQV